MFLEMSLQVEISPTVMTLLLESLDGSLVAVADQLQQVLPALGGEAILQVHQELHVLLPGERPDKEFLKVLSDGSHQLPEIHRLVTDGRRVILMSKIQNYILDQTSSHLKNKMDFDP